MQQTDRCPRELGVLNTTERALLQVLLDEEERRHGDRGTTLARCPLPLPHLARLAK